ncbi:hypothetical protein SAMN05428944_6252 [Streptomyces sp. 1222.5]|uniref:hypothetical protein n=1 Tax=unclassified Streptomyces TaxID=2593676 RepID=UPI000897B863|nr:MULTISPECIES: hypothetical protein [unclassified Streptomyces]PKW06686.1 hypothetical protein BX260_1843 [Streptomyces sp. 5112.2]SEC62434.1 hypothetical protein SAMN05216532_1925 [Streptomyces sp. 2231.1]SED07316.1 hypothetical protein SAMN05428944_6252 [Streptomyces sp. 1222.5]
MTADPEHPVVQGELAELRRRLDVAYARVEGGLALLSHRTEETAKELDELSTRMVSLEHARWPLPSLAALTALGALVVAVWQVLTAR